MLWFGGPRTPLPRAVAPGGSLELEASVEPPPLPGDCRLGWVVVQEPEPWIRARNGLAALSVAALAGEPVAGARRPEGGPLPVADVRFQHGRLALWSVALRMLAERPLLGHGPDSFRLGHGRHLGVERWNRTHRAHSTPLEILAAGGLLAGAALVWLLLSAAASSRRVWRVADLESSPYLVALGAALVAIALHGLVDVFLQVTPTCVIILLCLGLLAACDDRALSATG